MVSVLIERGNYKPRIRFTKRKIQVLLNISYKKEIRKRELENLTLSDKEYLKSNLRFGTYHRSYIHNI